ncbi:MAG: efflux RND transporter periplasmic adaptor subunit [Crocinitomix sp.]|nr:efflux RND transporter periplasmic adaptor subunit [Crocinitomix sp.]
MKKYLIYIGILGVGLILGWILFSNPSTDASKNDLVENHSHDEETNEIWTCSMHPQIRKNEPGDCPICGMTLIPATDNGSSSDLVLEMTDEAIKLSNIQTTVLTSSEHQNGSLELSGKVQENEENAASLVTQISGRIEKLYVSYTGEQVNKGQKIAQIYSPTLINAQKELLEADKIKATNPNLLEASKTKLRNWKITDAQISKILTEQKVQETFIIYAAYSGVIINKKVSVGDHLKAGEVLFDIQNLNSLWVIFDAYENDLSAINVGDEITFTTTALPSEIFKAKVAFIDPAINAITRTVSIRAEVNNRNKKLKPEMFVQGTISLSTDIALDQNMQVYVPKTAVLWTGFRSVVYVKLPKTKIPSFEFREIEIGQTVGDRYLVTKGLKQGDEVVTNGAFVIDAAAQLNNQSSMMNRNILDK